MVGWFLGAVGGAAFVLNIGAYYSTFVLLVLRSNCGGVFVSAMGQLGDGKRSVRPMGFGRVRKWQGRAKSTSTD